MSKETGLIFRPATDADLPALLALRKLKAYRDAACWQLAQLQIAPPFQGQGLGARVLAGLLAQVDAQALPACLSVLKPNPARHLYERCGFRIVGEEGQEYLMRREPGAV